MEFKGKQELKVPEETQKPNGLSLLRKESTPLSLQSDISKGTAPFPDSHFSS